jgi:hypothetical protein
MRKLVSFLPLIATALTFLWGFIQPSVWPYINAHPHFLQLLSAAFVASESLAATDLVKSNSVSQMAFDLVVKGLAKVLNK